MSFRFRVIYSRFIYRWMCVNQMALIVYVCLQFAQDSQASLGCQFGVKRHHLINIFQNKLLINWKPKIFYINSDTKPYEHFFIVNLLFFDYIFIVIWVSEIEILFYIHLINIFIPCLLRFRDLWPIKERTLDFFHKIDLTL